MLSSCTSESPVFGVLRLKPRLISTARLAVVCCRALICAREWQHSMAKRTSCVYCLIFRPRLGWVGGGGGGRILSLKDHQSDCVSAPPPRSGIKIIKKVRFRAGGRAGRGRNPSNPRTTFQPQFAKPARVQTIANFGHRLKIISIKNFTF